VRAGNFADVAVLTKSRAATREGPEPRRQMPSTSLASPITGRTQTRTTRCGREDGRSRPRRHAGTPPGALPCTPRRDHGAGRHYPRHEPVAASANGSKAARDAGRRSAGSACFVVHADSARGMSVSRRRAWLCLAEGSQGARDGGKLRESARNGSRRDTSENARSRRPVPALKAPRLVRATSERRRSRASKRRTPAV
jgi:hypothetical protein